MSADGTLSGTPTAEGTYSFVVIVQDAASQVGGLSKTITIVRRMSAAGSCARLCSVEAGCFNVCGSLGSIDGGAGPYKASLIGGSVPKGMGLAPLALTGAFPSPSNFSLSVLITDALGATATVSANFSVFPHIALLSEGNPSCVGYGCEVRVPYSLGTPNSTPTLTISNVRCGYDPNDLRNNPCSGASPEPPANTLPSGFSAVISGGAVIVDFGNPSSNGNWTGSLVITVTDQSPCSASSNCSASLTVNVDDNTQYG